MKKTEVKFDNLPKEIREKMLEHQRSQKGIANADVFRAEISAYDNGFDWNKSPEGIGFWYNILLDGGGYEEFYKLYPKKETREKTFPREMWCWDNDVRDKKVKDIVLAVFPERDSEYKVIGNTNTYTNCSEIEKKDFEIMKVKIEGTVYQRQNDGEPYFNVDGRKFFERFHEDNLPRLKYRDMILEVKRLRDGTIFKINDEIETSASDSYCSIYAFKTDHEGNLKVDCTHSFLAHKKKINLFQNMEHKKISYPVGTKVFNSNTKNIYTKKEDGWYKKPEKTAYTDKDISNLTFLSIIG